MALITKNRIALIIGLAGIAALLVSSFIHFGRGDFMATMQALFGVLTAVTLGYAGFGLRTATGAYKLILVVIAVGLALAGTSALFGAFAYI